MGRFIRCVSGGVDPDMTLKTWTLSELNELKGLVLSQRYTYPEIAKLMGKTRSQCQQRAQYMGLKNPVYGIRQTKHAHLRGKLLRYYLNHSAPECQKKFNLTPSEFKSCLTIAYKNPKWAHIRKETRRHDPWSIEEVKFLLRHSGIQSRTWISRKLKRGGVYSVKESLSRLNIKSKHLNGMPLTWVELLCGGPLEGSIKTKAGPRGQDDAFCFRIIPWVRLERLIEKRKVQPDIYAAIKVMAKFQRWAFGTQNEGQIVNQIQKYAKVKT